MVDLSIKLRTNDGFELQAEDATLNAKMKRRGDNEGKICLVWHLVCGRLENRMTLKHPSSNA